MLEVEKINKKFNSFEIKNLSFKVEKGDYFVILGVSGSGKSVLLEIISGLISSDSGNIFLEGENISRKKIQKRKIGLVFQDFAVFPHLSVFDNIAYPLKFKKLKKSKIKLKVENIATEMNISHLLEREVKMLSGGEKQRVALARTLLLEPKILLLDEPLTSLDVILRNEIRGLLREINRKGITIVHVTHEYEEAISLANKVAIMQNGEIVQYGKPKIVFQNPESEFVANFSGDKNFFKTKIVCDEKSGTKVAEIENDMKFIIATECDECEGNIIIKSNKIILSKEKIESSACNNFRGKIGHIVPTTNGVEVKIDIGVFLYVVITKSSSRKLDLSNNINIWLSFKATAIKFIKT